MTTHTQNLIDEIEALHSSDFEKMCYDLIDALTETHLHHMGLTVRGESQGYTADSYSDNGHIVGEYSTDRKYFSDLKKPEKDIKHAIDTFPKVEHIYLFAGVCAKPKEKTSMAALCNSFSSCSIEWYDARGIAEIILKRLAQNLLIERLSKYLPSLERIALSYPNTASLPRLPKNYRISDKVSDDAAEMLSKNHILLLSGISGVGKTCLSVKIAQNLIDKCFLNSVFFVDGTQIVGTQSLDAINMECSGQKINLIGMLKSQKALAIIDDLQKNIDSVLEELRNEIGCESYVIVSSQKSSAYAKTEHFEYQVPFLSEELSKEVINRHLPKEKQFDTERLHLIYEKTKGYPLALNCLRAIVQYENADSIEIVELLDGIAMAEAENGQTIMQRLLDRHKDVLFREMFAINWLECKYISRPLLERIITKSGVNKLLKRFLVQELSGIIKIHDIVYQCIIEMVSFSSSYEREDAQCKQKFYQFFEDQHKSKPADYFRALHLHEKKLSKLAMQCQTPGKEWYFYIQSQHYDDMGIFDNTQFTEEDLARWLNSNEKYTVGIALEYIENHWGKKIAYNDAAMQRKIAMVASAAKSVSLTSPVYTSIYHHLGKLYRKHGDIKEALKCFDCVISHSPEYYQTRLQIAKIYRDTDPNMAVREYANLLDSYMHDKTISMSVVLSAYEDFNSLNKPPEMQKYYYLDGFLFIQRAVSSMALESFDLPYRTLSKIFKYYSYNAPDLLFQLIDSVPLPSLDSIGRRSYFDIAQMYKEAGKAIMWAETPCSNKKPSDYYEMAELFYAQLDGNLKQPYQCTQRSENLILLNNFEDAVTLLANNPNQNNIFWNYRMGQALAGTDERNLSEAVEHLKQAIEDGKKDSKNQIYLSAFYHELGNVLLKMKSPDSKHAYEQALAYCTNDKHKRLIELDMKR